MSPATLVEIFAVIFSIIAVTLQVKQHPWGWPLTLVGVTGLAWVYFGGRLYAEMGTQVIYFIQGAYGWWYWLHGGTKRDEAPIRKLDRRGWTYTLLVIVLGTILLGYPLSQFTNASVPWLDTFLSVTSLTANFLLARKIIENWAMWIFVDVLYIGMFLYVGLYLIAGLYLVFLVLATMGLLEWRKAYASPGGSEVAPA